MAHFQASLNSVLRCLSLRARNCHFLRRRILATNRESVASSSFARNERIFFLIGAFVKSSAAETIEARIIRLLIRRALIRSRGLIGNLNTGMPFASSRLVGNRRFLSAFEPVKIPQGIIDKIRGCPDTPLSKAYQSYQEETARRLEEIKKRVLESSLLKTGGAPPLSAEERAAEKENKKWAAVIAAFHQKESEEQNRSAQKTLYKQSPEYLQQRQLAREMKQLVERKRIAVKQAHLDLIQQKGVVVDPANLDDAIAAALDNPVAFNFSSDEAAQKSAQLRRRLVQRELEVLARIAESVG